jgi:hypothetical protein
MKRTPEQREHARRLVRLLETVRICVGVHDVTVPVIISVSPGGLVADVIGQLPAGDLAGTAAALVEWANTLTGVTGEMWRPAAGDSVHLSVIGATGSGVRIRIYGAVPADPILSASVEPGGQRVLSLAQFADWANLPNVTGGGASA